VLLFRFHQQTEAKDLLRPLLALEHARAGTIAIDSRRAFGLNIDAPCGHSKAPTLSPPPFGWGFCFGGVTANSRPMARVMPTQVVQTIDALFPRAVKNQGNVN
jgi:hypothetical protein